MRKTGLLIVCGVASLLIGINTSPVEARKQYSDEFKKLYVKDPAVTDADKEWEKAVTDASCFVCHIGKKKTNRNEYGKKLTDQLGKKNEKDAPKINAALKAIEKEPSDPNKADSPKFGERIKAGKLPVDPVREDPKDK